MARITEEVVSYFSEHFMSCNVATLKDWSAQGPNYSFQPLDLVCIINPRPRTELTSAPGTTRTSGTPLTS